MLEKAAALSGEGKIYAQLAGVYLDIDGNAKAVTAAQNTPLAGIIWLLF